MGTPRALPLCLTLVALFGLAITSASAQGLLGIGRFGSEVTESSPLRVAVGAQAGYDSNVNTAPKKDKQDSYYTGGGVGVFYALANERTRLDLGGNFAVLWYDDPPDEDSLFYNTRLTANLGHTIDRRLKITNNGMIAYEVEPDYLIGASSALRNGQYLYWYDRTAVWYDVTPRLSSETSYAVHGVNYESNDLSRTEDRIGHIFGELLRYALNDTTGVRLEYRYGILDYQEAPYDSNSHYVLAGIDHQLSEYATATFMGGAENREYDIGGDSFWKPYGEAAVRYQFSEDTSVRWMARYGLEDNEVFGFRDRISFRTGLNFTHRIADRLTANAGAAYVRSRFESEGGGDIVDDAISLHAGLTYELMQNLSLNAGYYFTTYSSDDDYRNYDRHRVVVGATSAF